MTVKSLKLKCDRVNYITLIGINKVPEVLPISAEVRVFMHVQRQYGWTCLKLSISSWMIRTKHYSDYILKTCRLDIPARNRKFVNFQEQMSNSRIIQE